METGKPLHTDVVASAGMPQQPAIQLPKTPPPTSPQQLTEQPAQIQEGVQPVGPQQIVQKPKAIGLKLNESVKIGLAILGLVAGGVVFYFLFLRGT